MNVECSSYVDRNSYARVTNTAERFFTIYPMVSYGNAETKKTKHFIFPLQFQLPSVFRLGLIVRLRYGLLFLSPCEASSACLLAFGSSNKNWFHPFVAILARFTFGGIVSTSTWIEKHNEVYFLCQHHKTKQITSVAVCELDRDNREKA